MSILNIFRRILIQVTLCGFLLIIVFPKDTESIGCWQCGTFYRGIRDECDLSDRQFFNCTACLKTYTRTYLHHSWRQLQHTTKISKTCIPKNSYARKAGCYSKTSAAGYMTQCYCYEEFCNRSSEVTLSAACIFAVIASYIIKG